jgi:hypothetical protein
MWALSQKEKKRRAGDQPLKKNCGKNGAHL